MSATCGLSKVTCALSEKVLHRALASSLPLSTQYACRFPGRRVEVLLRDYCYETTVISSMYILPFRAPTVGRTRASTEESTSRRFHGSALASTEVAQD